MSIIYFQKSTDNSSDSRHASFFLDSASPPVCDGNPLLHDIAEKREHEEMKENENNKCCNNNCRHRPQIKPAREISNIDEADSIKTEKKKFVLLTKEYQLSSYFSEKISH